MNFPRVGFPAHSIVEDTQSSVSSPFQSVVVIDSRCHLSLEEGILNFVDYYRFFPFTGKNCSWFSKQFFFHRNS
jgi:hypothetical protein